MFSYAQLAGIAKSMNLNVGYDFIDVIEGLNEKGDFVKVNGQYRLT